MTTTMADAENTDVPETIQEEASTEGTDQAQEATQNDAATEEVAQEVQEASAAGDQPQQQEVEEGSGEAPTENTETPATPGAAESPGEAEQEAKKEEDSEQKEGEGGQEGKTAGEQAEQHHSTEGVREGPDDTASPTEQQLNTEEGTDKQDVEQQGLAEDAPTEQAAEGDGNTDAAPATEGDDTEAAKREGEEGQEAPAVEGETGETGDVTAEQGEEQQQEGEGQAEEAEVAQSPVPQADTFEQGSKPDSPMAVGEKLSREGSPIQQVLEPERTMSPPVPGSPGQVASLVGSDEEEEEEEEDYDEPQYDREALVERYHQALSERQQLQEQNYQLQHKLAEYFRRKKADDRQDMDKNVTDQEQRYLKYMANLDELRRQDAEERENFKQMIEEMKERCEDKQTKVHDEQAKFTEFKKEIALGSLNSRSGKPIPPRDVEQYFINESRKEEEVIKVRLENIKLKNKLKKKEAQLKSKEELAEGLHMIDFEQLKIENQTYNEKIEERNEELLKLRKKITSTVQVLTHLKEKLQFVTGENGQLKTTLQDVEEHAARKRDILSRTKQARDALRIDNQRLRQNCGLLGNESLLRDFEERKDESDDLRDKLDNLKTLHAELTLNLNGVRRKIQQAQVGRQ